MRTVKLLVKRNSEAKDLALPKYMSQGAAGLDLCANVQGEVEIKPGEIKLVSTGLSVSIPEGFEAQVRPRSGLALKHGLTLLNTPGTIDSDYRGVISLILINLGKESYVVKRGVRLAQMVLNEIVRAEIEECDELEETQRAAGGFGHTGA